MKISRLDKNIENIKSTLQKVNIFKEYSEMKNIELKPKEIYDPLKKSVVVIDDLLVKKSSLNRILKRIVKMQFLDISNKEKQFLYSKQIELEQEIQRRTQNGL
jgi:DNA-binding MarR family transcriptional regulator